MFRFMITFALSFTMVWPQGHHHSQNVEVDSSYYFKMAPPRANPFMFLDMPWSHHMFIVPGYFAGSLSVYEYITGREPLK
jgi:hypothetical protein